jgi:molybdopterin-guanine dinucleotide biosynthesis protein A
MEIEAFILIGGQSSRFGANKAFAELGGIPLAAHAATVAATLSPVRITFVAASEAQFETADLLDLIHPIVADLKPGFGAWSGLHAALAYARSEWILVLACDLPMVSPQLLQLLGALVSVEYEAIVPMQADGRLQPLCAFYSAQPVLAAVETVLIGRNIPPPLASIFDDVRTLVVGYDEYREFSNADKLFLNVNTRNDLEAVVAATDL